MTSELKSATARANGAKSRGPKSPETREKSSRNSLTHGFTARHTIVLECENNDEFLAMVADYVADYQPGSPVEENLVNEMAAARWRTMRLRMIEVAMLDSEINRPHPPNDPRPQPTDPGHQIAAAFRRLVDDSGALQFVSRYESRLHRIHERSHRTLCELQQLRKQQAAEPVSPPPVQPEPQPEPDLCGGPVPCQPAPAPEPVPIENRKNEPKPAGSAVARKHVERRVIARHRGILSYIGSKGFRCLQRRKTARVN